MADTTITLGKWLVAEYAVSISSLVASILALLVILLATTLSKYPLLSRPALRLHITQAFCTLFYVICRILAYHNTLQHANEQALRAYLWLTQTVFIGAQFISMLICVHVLLTVTTGRIAILHRMQMFYEIFCFLLAVLVAHPIMYTYRSVEWNSDERMVVLDGKWFLYTKYAWAAQLAWVTLAIVGSLIASVGIHAKSERILKELKQLEAWMSLETFERAQTLSDAQPVNTTKLGSEVHLMAIRISMHALLPLVSGIWLIICALAPQHRWIYGLATVMAAMQGILGLALLLVNPALDNPRKQLTEYMRGIVSGSHNSSSLHLEFSQLDNTSTICLSPYQSRNNSSDQQEMTTPSTVI